MTDAAESSDLSKATPEEALKRLGTDPEAGVRAADLERLRREYGPNEVAEEKPHWLRGFLRKFWGLSAWMLELIIVLSWLTGRRWDAAIVSTLLLINAVIGSVQDLRAGSAVEMLRSRLKVNARVLRDGAWAVLLARELVPGDIVRLRSGDFVPADLKILSGELGVDQSSLTGESLEAEKAPGDLLYCGSIVRRGEAGGLVLLTGRRTFFGRTTELVQTSKPKLHLEEVISKVVKWLFLIVGILVGVAVGISLLRGTRLLEILPLTLVLLLSAVPVALPVMFTVSMAVGAMELARRGVLVTRLSAAEDAATMDVLCLDKTGTLTLNRLAIAAVEPSGASSESEIVLYGALASKEANQDPLDRAFLERARGMNLPMSAYRQESFVPFSPQTRRTEAEVSKEGTRWRVMKGAVRTVAQGCGLSVDEVGKLETRAHEKALQGFRTLAVARTGARGTWELSGLVFLSDPPHPESKALIARLRSLGISVKMLTGDALPVAQETAREVGLERVGRMADLSLFLKDDPRAGAALAWESDGFAEVYPQDKHAIVQVLQASGHVVGMTGDGVNDAPALRQAEVGIAVANATDVAKGAASVVLTDPGLGSIVDLVTGGRAIYQRILTWILNKLSRTILKSGVVVIAFLVTGQFVVSTLGMMLLLFMTDFVKVSLATDHVRGSEKPETWNLGQEVSLGVGLGVVMVVEVLGLLGIGWKVFDLGPASPAMPTFTFQVFLLFALFSIVSIRERRPFWASRPSGLLLGGLLFEFLGATVIPSVGFPGLPRLPLRVTLASATYALVFSLFVNDAIKVAWWAKGRRKKGNPPETPRPSPGTP